ncbi:MAG TPA: SH3 domain-containing protein, partial [Caldilineaceae bacterium]|nr:SH3 domain-containing protein [Caldilineaceae bacterium]
MDNMLRGQWRRRLMAVALIITMMGAAQLATKQLYGQSPGVVYVPLVPSYESVATPVATLADGERVYGLLGRIEAAQMRRYSFYLTTADGGRYGLVGETPEIERQLGTLASGAPPVMVKVWGVLSGQANAAREPVIVVSGVLSTDAPLGVGAAAEPVAIVKFNRVNLHAEPRESAATVGSVTLRQACNITGRNPVSTWYLLACADGQEGWIDARLVEVQGSTAAVPAVAVAPPVTPAATPTPEPPATPTVRTFHGWRMEMYDNPILSGEPVAVADVPAIDFNWGNQAPSPSLPADGFSL